MRFKRITSSFLLAVMLMVSVLPNFAAHAQNGTTISLAVPSFWKNLITEDFLNDFESQYGVDVYVTYVDAGFTSASSDIATHLDEGQDYVSQADVVYLDDSILTPERTRAGYFLDLAPLIAGDGSLDTSDFYRAALQSFQWDAGTWGLPTSLDVILMTYDTAAFDEAGLAYPTSAWTLADFANAARVLSQVDASGTVTVPGLSVATFGDNLALFLRSLLSHGLYDDSTLPNAPSFSDPALETLLADFLVTWQELEDEGVISTGFGDNSDQIPLRIEQSSGLSGFGPDSVERSGALLPGDTAGITVEGFGVSSGTQNPELAYELIKYLTTRPEVANSFRSSSPARRSMVGVQADQVNAQGSSGPGGGGISFSRGGNLSPENQAIVDEAIEKALPLSEMRFTDYITIALQAMRDDGLDAHSALQEIEQEAIAAVQTADDRRSTVAISIVPPPEPVVLAPGEVALNFGMASSFIVIGPGGGLPNQEQWDQLSQDFAANDPDVGAVNVEQAQGQSLEDLAQNYDCFTLGYNAVSGDSDLSSILSLDPFLDTDVNFSRNDVIGTTLIQLQHDNKTWALPIGIQAQVLRYDIDQFNNAGVPLPDNGWTVDEFADALESLQYNLGDTAAFQPIDPSGNYLLMLIAAYGGLPIDYRTDPPTINYTDPATVDAIRQVLDLAKNGYINYQELGGNSFSIRVGGEDDTAIAITTDSLSPFSFRRGGPPGSDSNDNTAIVTYPRGTTYNAISYNTVTGYVSANAENPEACYRWLSEIARHPELYSAMPARTSLLSDPSVTAVQGEDLSGVYNDLANLINDPNTITFPESFRQGGSPADFALDFWLKRAFDRYVLEDADIQVELEQAQQYTTDYMTCINSLPPYDPSSTDLNYLQEYFGQVTTCAATADPTYPIPGQ
ncbi:MAG: extracellular solute-binding protein [Chloroflexi bacterium]|nr:extracellular solute-binding protein [Chloroflexota bacterium]